jgi:hypothetical protein
LAVIEFTPNAPKGQMQIETGLLPEEAGDAI